MSVFVLGAPCSTRWAPTRLNVGPSALVAALAATTYQPTRCVLRGVVDQLLFGERPGPARRRVGGSRPDRRGPRVALRAIREALVIPYAALVVDGEPVAVVGHARPRTPAALDLDGAGELVVGLRPGDLTLLGRRRAGAAADRRRCWPRRCARGRWPRTCIESRGQTIAAVEEERRRLRRELHDGLGPRLSGVAFTSDAARNLIRSDPAAAEELVTQLRADTVTAIEEIRRMVYAMRPPALDELGLVPALRQQAVGLRNRDGDPVAVDVTAPEEFPDLPAAVEVAAYRIVTEALTNVARHSTSASRRCGSPRPPTGCTSRSPTAAAAERGGRVSGCRRCASAPPSWAGRSRPGRAPPVAGWPRCSPSECRQAIRVPARHGGREIAMSENAAMIVVVIAVVLVVAAVGLLLWRTRGRERHAREAAELRSRADAQTVEMDHAQRTAASRRAAAEAAREQAELAEARAAEAERELAQTEAQYENTVRDADRLDPLVDDRSDHYVPGRPTSPRHRT